jgi:hypothetical protein
VPGGREDIGNLHRGSSLEVTPRAAAPAAITGRVQSKL